MSVTHIKELPKLQLRPADGHKGTFGRVLIFAGSPGMTGAAALSGLGALRGGAGLVTIASGRRAIPVIAAVEPSYLTLPLPDNRDGELKLSALEELKSAAEGKDAIAMGPGLGQSAKVQRIIWSLFQDLAAPMIVDADALNALAEEPDAIKTHGGPRILTPHPGEFARLTGTSIQAVQEQRESRAVEFARANRVVLVLKGKGTVVTDGERVYVNTTGNSGMATGGTGDVLTGLTAALACRFEDAFEAAQLAVFLHGTAGDLAAEALSEPGMISSDLASYLPAAWKKLATLST